MARQRPLKPEYFSDKTMGQLGSQIGTVYLALSRWADDGGAVRIEPDLLKGHIFTRWPEYTSVVLTEALVRLHGAGKIAPYSVGDELYALLPSFGRIGAVNNPSKFRYPRGGQAVTDIRAWVNGQYSLSPHVAIREPSSSNAVTSTDTGKEETPAADIQQRVRKKTARGPRPVGESLEALKLEVVR